MRKNNAFKLITKDKPHPVEPVVAPVIIEASKCLKIGYKGFDKDMACNSGNKKHVYEIVLQTL